MKKQEIKLKEYLNVFVDNKTNARTIAFPFRLPDGTSAVLMVCRLKDEQWKPLEEIKNIIINYKDENKTS